MNYKIMKKLYFLLIISTVIILTGCGVTDVADIITGENASVNDNFYGPRLGSENIERDGIFNALVVSPTDPNIVYVGTETNGVFKSTDGGENWEWLRTGLYHNQRSFPEAYDMKIDPDDENIIYAVFTNGPQPIPGEDVAGFYISFDAGQTWERRINGLPNSGTTSVALLDDTLFVGLDGEETSNFKWADQTVPGGIYKSTDQGLNWEKVNIPEAGIQNKYNKIIIRDGIIFTNGQRWKGDEKTGMRQVDADNSIGIIKSTDNGQTWLEIQPDGVFSYYWDISPDGQTIYFNDGVTGDSFKSTDTAQNWEKLSLSFSNTIKISPHNPNIILFATGNQLQKSTDGMITSQMVFQTDAEGFDDIEYSSDPNIIYAGGGGYRIYKSIDGGDSFTEIANLREYIDNY